MHTQIQSHVSAPSALVALSSVPAGAVVRIEQLGECPAMRSRLLALGLTPGATAVVESCGCGQCCLCVRGGSLAIGHGMANRIMVRLLQSQGHGATAEEGGDVQARPCCGAGRRRGNVTGAAGCVLRHEDRSD